MFKKIQNLSYEVVDPTPHPEFESRNTSVSEYFRKYALGKTDQMPQDMRPEVSDDRSSDEMLEDDSKINHMGCDDLDVLQEMNDNAEKFEEALKDIELTKKQRQMFEDATKILNDPNTSLDQKKEAYAVLEEINDKVTRARTN